MTGPGYANIGTKGNIKITSTFGNIGINTVKNEALFNFDKDYICMAWNPGYLNNLAAIQATGLDISKDIILTDLNPNLFDIKAIFKNFIGTLILYDGFPTFLPCRMIMQNPNVIPTSSWFEDFRTIDDDWTNVTNTAYWKLISKVIGNIDIKSWNGDINIETEGTLGNGGNIRLTANNKNGALPGYNCGNILMKSNTDFKIYTDPRDVFFDTDLQQKLNGGKFAFFSHNPEGTTEINDNYGLVDPAEKFLLEFIKNAFGITADVGFASNVSLAGSCPKCIYDTIKQALLDLKVLNGQQYNLVQLSLNKNLGSHKFNSFSPSFFDKERGFARWCNYIPKKSINRIRNF